MAHVKIDIHRKSRALDAQFDYSTAHGVKAIFRAYERLNGMRKNGSIDAAIILMDARDALRRASLSPQERTTVYYHYMRGISLPKTAELMAISKQTASEYVEKALDKVHRFMRPKGSVVAV